MKKINKYFLSFITLVLLVSCQKDDFSFGAIDTPTNLQVTAEIIGKTAEAPNGDGSGKIKFTTIADNAISYKYIFSDGTTQNSPSGIFEKRFTKTGVNTYNVTVIVTGAGGVASNTTLEVTVLSNFTDPEAVQFLTSGTASGKKWYWAQSEVGHLGVGPNTSHTDPTFGKQNYYPSFYSAAKDEKRGTCLYNSVMTFSLDGEQLKFSLDNQNETYFNAKHAGVAGGSGNDDKCYNYDTSGLKSVTLSPSESFVSLNPDHVTQTRGTMINISDGGFMGYYVGQSSYEILSITANRMVVRCIDKNNSFLAWYHIFTTTSPNQTPDADYTNLIWSDEFNTDGAPDAAKWGYDLGAGGWGNGEAQTYTNSANNVIVQGGNLKITAKKEGSNYTSTRLKTEGKFDFTYGKIEVKAKLPTGGGTWPAVWSLGSDYATNTWPACGEIDFMEHKGNVPNVIHGSLHYPGHSGGNPSTGTTTIANASTEFHVYKTVWSPASVKFYIDDNLYHSFANDNTVPFNKDFFLIINVAMGGTFGGTIDSAFLQSSMEIDYIRVYQ
nr:family 16 glycosylhydrolase [uncultured Flavobacterium sp.]